MGILGARPEIPVRDSGPQQEFFLHDLDRPQVKDSPKLGQLWMSQVGSGIRCPGWAQRLVGPEEPRVHWKQVRLCVARTPGQLFFHRGECWSLSLPSINPSLHLDLPSPILYRPPPCLTLISLSSSASLPLRGFDAPVHSLMGCQ